MGTSEISTQWQDVNPLSSLLDIAYVLGLNEISSGINIDSISGGSAFDLLSLPS